MDHTTKRYLMGCYVTGDVDYMAYAIMSDANGSIWWDVSEATREHYRNRARALMAQGADIIDFF